MSRHTSMDPAHAGLAVDRWPPPYRLAWQQALEKQASPFREDGGGIRRAPDTLRKSEKGLRRWLGFLNRLGVLDDKALLQEQLTPELLDQYFAHLVACANADRNITGRYQELQLAFELMYPDRNFRWLTRPNGIPLEQLLEMRTRPRFVPSSVDLLKLADELF